MAACGVGEAHRPQSSSASRFTAAQAGFLLLSQSVVQPNARAFLADDDLEGVVLDLMQPSLARRYAVGRARFLLAANSWRKPSSPPSARRLVAVRRRAAVYRDANRTLPDSTNR
jgi:hypothetical protein